MTGAVPAPRFDHLRRLTDARGMFEHSNGDEPRRELGYCTDDVARGLVLAASVGDEIADLGQVYLRFVIAAIAEDGQCHNRMGPDGRWTDRPSLGDWWGRALWGLGAYVAMGKGQPEARSALDRMLRMRSPYRRATAYALLGAAPLYGTMPESRDLVVDAATSLAAPQSVSGLAGPWRWPEPRLTYDNAAVPHALLVAGDVLERGDLVERGLDQLDFLASLQRRAGHLSIVPVGGWGPGDGPPGFDQQPIEVASLSAAAATAFDLTGDPRWRDLVGEAAAWFLGENDGRVAMMDVDTGAGYDGLTSDGRNVNRGAESTLAAVSTVFHAHRLGARA
ncbi:MAG: glycosyltransferase [Actinobacteria bacterium]|nr:glycosyltransferase [Actinomycetota bacterium]